MNHFSLFTGIGGIDLAAEWAGFTTVGQCELADYPYKVLCKHWPDVPKWRDVRDVTTETIKHVGPIKLISAGYPCQPFSLAGKRQGDRDDRHLWPEVYRLLKEVNPTWFIGENVAGHVSLGLDKVLSDLDSLNYSWQPFIVPAAAVNAPHRRDRVFIVARNAESYDIGTLRRIQEGADTNTGGICEDVAHSLSHRQYRQTAWESPLNKERNNKAPKQSWETEFYETVTGSKNVCHTTGEGLQDRTERKMGNPGEVEKFERSNWWAIEPDVGRVANGIPSRVDRLKCLGNAVVPQQVYPILKAIKEAN